MSLLPQTAQRVDEIVARGQAAGRAPSLVAAVVRDGALAHFTGAGEQPHADPKIQYRIGSISKTMTATLVLQLRDEGRLTLDDLLYRHLPGTPVGSVTLRQLLSHAAGLQREPDGDWWERSAGVDLDGFLARLTPDKLAHPPNHTYHYSNLAYGLLGAVLERLTGERWVGLLGKRLLEPLGLRRTTYQPMEPFARGYVVHPWHGTLREEPRYDARAMAPAGQLWSTAADMATWATFLADPAPAVLAPGTLAEMCAPMMITDPEAWTGGYGLGIQSWRRGERIYVGHTGSMPGYLSVLMVHRASRTGVVLFANAYNLRGASMASIGLDALTAVLDSEPSPPPAPWRPGTQPPPDVAPLCGRWWWMGIEVEAAWDSGASSLVLTTRAGRGSTDVWRFDRESADRWRCRSGSNDGEIMTVQRDAAGVPSALDIATFVFRRRPD
ncbi:MAG TPA: serine hydrolase domain-containing protein [Micromonosporaceae bacterium]|nr:serine hydrolase domain-containing protein [Micromonosporaceae bacterium]